MIKPAIDEAFAKELLRALYKLDDPIGRLDAVLSGLKPGNANDEFKSALGDIMGIVLSELMIPIYRAQPKLGRPSEPGQWLHEK